ncbi:MAG TPA: GNAT family N-acetyltransferase [Acidimicrobiales bacterium]|nr:GNAT family N-acetyltransferase [Acidimicrobiales bacterium]
MDLRVRTVEASEIDAWTRCMGVGFLYTVPEGYGEYFLGDVDLRRTWGAFDGERVVGTLRSFATPFTVPGPTEVEVAALTNVTVAPTHRRRGLLTEMITSELRGSAEREEAVGILIASEYPIYGRFGYGAAIEAAAYSIDLAPTRFAEAGSGSVELVDLLTMRNEAPALYERFRARQPGSIERNARWWDQVLHRVDVPGAKKPEGYQALYRSAAGAFEGYVRYRATQSSDHMRPTGEVTVDELVATTPDAYQRLWRYCCEIDLVATLRAGDRSVGEPLGWLLEDARTLRQTGRYDFVWVRVIDVAGALAARRYGVDGHLIIEVSDDLGFATGRYALDGGPSGATCTRTDASADLSMPVDAVGSLYAGGVSAQVLRDIGRIDEHRAGAVDRAAVMFQTSTPPWCSTWF